MKSITFIIVLALGLGACTSRHTGPEEDAAEREERRDSQTIRLNPQQREAIGLKTDTLEKRALSGTVKVNGVLELPPQNHAYISAVAGGNIKRIYVIEGNRVEAGQTLALLEHPDFVQMQTDFRRAASRLELLEAAYERQKKLYENEVGSGKDFQQTQADYRSVKAEYEGVKAKLEMYNLDTDKVLAGEIFRYIRVITPINGYVGKIRASLGQYVEPQREFIEVMNNEHIHADLMVYEKDIYKIKEGQQVYLQVANRPGEELEASIFLTGKSFESEPRALHVHAEIKNGTEDLLPGMYVQARIATGQEEVPVLPEDGVVTEGDQAFIFIREPGGEKTGQDEQVFKKVEVKTGMRDGGYVEIRLPGDLPEDAEVVSSGAYYLFSAMTETEGHAH